MQYAGQVLTSLIPIFLVPIFVLQGIVPSLAQSQPSAFLPPPRTIADITAILDLEKPNPEALATMRAEADAEPPLDAGRGDRALFLYHRCEARAKLGESHQAIADCERAVELGQGSLDMAHLSRLRQGLVFQYQAIGDPKKALRVLLQSARETNVKGAKGFLFNIQRHIANSYIQLGDFSQAEAYVRRSQSLIVEARTWPKYAGFRKASWEGDVEHANARLLEARGQFREAEASYRRAEVLRRESLRLVHTYGDGLPPAPGQLEQAIDITIASQGRVKAQQGRFAEGEADVRRALLSRLKATGKYNLQTSKYIGFLANLLVEQGRFAEAEQLMRTQTNIHQALGVPSDSQIQAMAMNQLASVVNLQGRWAEAAKIYEEVEAAVKQWEPARREALQLNAERIDTLYNTNNLTPGLTAAERLLTRHKVRFGEQHVQTALTRALVAIGLARVGRDSDALREFKTAIPVIMRRSRVTDEDDATTTAAREQRVQVVVESYIGLLARMGPASGVDAAAESFRLVDVIRGQSVQRALTASSARAGAANPALADLARKAQDLDTQIAAQLSLLNNLLALPPQERDDRAVYTLQSGIEKMRTARDTAKRDLAVRFPKYSSLLEPVPPSVDDIRAVLRSDEAFVSFYLGRDNSFVWALSPTGPVAFAAIGVSAGEIDKKVQSVRAALEPQGTRISDIPEFDLQTAYDVYDLLLKPIESGWKTAKSLIVVTNGALGLLPLSLLPTEPFQLAQTSGRQELWFAGYRDVPWLARTHAVTLVPSAAALKGLRRMPPSLSRQEKMIGFGDPVFSRAQLTEAEQEASAAPLQVTELTPRGIPLRRRSTPHLDKVDSADLALLPRLPDTAEELTSIALALEVDPAKVLKLGIKANETAVKSADLSRYRVIVFATHGLVPGELNGLTQPALALSAPDVAGVEGDGLLTMEEILPLQLNADWVVLSACNTGTGAGAGAEAASGLGRAFFYAGTRAILVTNWSVDSDAARELTTDLFRRQAADVTLSRAEALHQSMLALIDGPGFKDERGRSVFSYAHPLFWAPYSIIGDGGGS